MTRVKVAELTGVALEAYKNLTANLAKYERLVLELMRHPEATPQQMVESGSGYRMIWDSWMHARAKLREKYPQRGMPWF